MGIILRSDEKAETISDDLDKFAVIALDFPAFGDGRAYSTARLYISQGILPYHKTGHTIWITDEDDRQFWANIKGTAA